MRNKAVSTWSAVIAVIVTVIAIFSSTASASEQKYPPGFATGIVDTSLADAKWADGYRQWFLSGVTKGQARKIAKTATDRRSMLTFLLLRDSAYNIPGLTTDADLGAWGADGGAPLKKAVSKTCTAVPLAEIRVLSEYSPEESTKLLNIICQPSYGVIVHKVFEPSTGLYWAAEDLATARTTMTMAGYAKRSAVLKLLADQKLITLPTSTKLVFRWSHATDIPIEIDPVSWSKKDLVELKKLSSNPIYGKWAREKYIAVKNGDTSRVGSK